jgi:hypothetical protein
MIKELLQINCVFTSVSAAGFVFLGLTQKTFKTEPMKTIRAIGYTVSTFLFVFGTFLFTINFLEKYSVGESLDPTRGLISALPMFIAFIIPAIVLLVFLLITKKLNYKSAAINERSLFVSEKAAKLFGIYSAALWVTAIIVSIVMFCFFELWGVLPAVLAVAAELVMLARFTKKG